MKWFKNIEEIELLKSRVDQLSVKISRKEVLFEKNISNDLMLLKKDVDEIKKSRNKGGLTTKILKYFSRVQNVEKRLLSLEGKNKKFENKIMEIIRDVISYYLIETREEFNEMVGELVGARLQEEVPNEVEVQIKREVSSYIRREVVHKVKDLMREELKFYIELAKEKFQEDIEKIKLDNKNA